MSTPPPPLFNFVAALSGYHARRPSIAPAAALWIYTPTIARVSLDEREQSISQLVEFFYNSLPPKYVAYLRAEAAGLLPSEALRLFHGHLDDRITSEYLR